MYHFIINPKSKTGNGYKVWEVVKKKLDEQKIAYTYHLTQYAFHATKIARKLCKGKFQAIYLIVIGGDGTVNEVINGISNYKNVFLGYIPSGSSNDLARSLNIPADPIKALELILNAKTYPCFDHGIVNLQNKTTSRKFSVSCGIGFDASICYEALDSKIKKWLNSIKLGKLTYAIIGLKQLITYRPSDVTLILDEHQIKQFKNVYILASMIQPYEGGGLMMAPKANPSDQKLSVCIIYDINKLNVLFLLPSLFWGRHSHFNKVELFECTSLEIKTKEPLLLHTDGEFVGHSNHVKLHCKKEQLHMLL